MTDTWWDVVLQAWPLTLFVPGVLIMLAGLVLVIRLVDGDA